MTEMEKDNKNSATENYGALFVSKILQCGDLESTLDIY